MALGMRIFIFIFFSPRTLITTVLQLSGTVYYSCNFKMRKYVQSISLHYTTELLHYREHITRSAPGDPTHTSIGRDWIVQGRGLSACDTLWGTWVWVCSESLSRSLSLWNRNCLRPGTYLFAFRPVEREQGEAWGNCPTISQPWNGNSRILYTRPPTPATNP